MSYHKHPKSSFYVYFARAGDMVKIGCSRMPVSRMTQIAEWIPFKIELVATVQGAFDLEADIHAYLADEWSHLEWFRVSEKVERLLADAKAGIPLNVPKCRRDTAKELFKTLKKRATSRVTQAEKRAGIERMYPDRWNLRPDYLKQAMESYEGHTRPPPSDEALAAIARYEAELAALPQRKAA